MIADFNSQIAHSKENTHLNYEIVAPLGSKEINPLIYFYSLDGCWVQRELPVEISRMRLGKNPYECEVKLSHSDADNVHVILQRTGYCWQIIESGKQELMRINGVRRRQAILEHGKQIIIQIGDMTLIFTTSSLKPKPEGSSAEDPQVFSLANGEYSLNCNGSMQKFFPS